MSVTFGEHVNFDFRFQGDSGGGLTCHHSDGRSFLMGIISWGREDCVHEEQPSVQTRIEPYMDWINAHLSESV